MSLLADVCFYEGEEGMNLEAHVETLTARHSEIEACLTREEHRPLPDRHRIIDLKKQKLLLKEELERLSAS